MFRFSDEYWAGIGLSSRWRAITERCVAARIIGRALDAGTPGHNDWIAKSGMRLGNPRALEGPRIPWYWGLSNPSGSRGRGTR